MDYAVHNDEALQRLAVSGDRLAEEALVSRYMQTVRACSRPFFLAGGDSEDLVQEGTVGLIDAVRQYDPTRAVSFRSFAQSCIRNRIYNAIKSASRLKHTPLNDYVPLESPQFDESQTQVFDTTRDPEDLIIAKERLNEIQDENSGLLSGLERKVLALYLEGLSCSEIASVLSRTPKSVDNAVQRIRQKLSQQI